MATVLLSDPSSLDLAISAPPLVGPVDHIVDGIVLDGPRSYDVVQWQRAEGRPDESVCFLEGVRRPDRSRILVADKHGSCRVQSWSRNSQNV